MTKATGAAMVSRGDGPLYAQIAAAIASGIADGKYAPGYRFPPEPELAATLGVSRLTLRQALTVLEGRGLIDRVVGRHGGTFVRKWTVDRDLTTFAGFSDQLSRQGRVAGAEVLSARQLAASAAVASGLDIAEGSQVFEVQRLRLANGTPVLLECSSFPAAAFPGLLDEPLDQSLYGLLGDRYGRRPTHAREVLEPVLVDRRAAKLLGVSAGTPVLLVERTAFDSDGMAVEYAKDLFLGDRTRVVVWSFDVPAH
ncbi:MAG: GntR family transcriptional regulator [Acidimicrobiales bacterium]|jgi:GntR family transcriptional regulator